MRCTSAMCVGVTILGFSIATACIAEDTSNVLPRHREMRVWTNADGTKSVRGFARVDS